MTTAIDLRWTSAVKNIATNLRVAQDLAAKTCDDQQQSDEVREVFETLYRVLHHASIDVFHAQVALGLVDPVEA